MKKTSVSTRFFMAATLILTGLTIILWALVQAHHWYGVLVSLNPSQSENFMRS